MIDILRVDSKDILENKFIIEFDTIYSRNIAIVISNFLNYEDLEKVLKRVDEIKLKSTIIHNNFGFTYPATIYMLDHISKEYIEDRYYSFAKNIIENTELEFGIQLNRYIDELFSKIFINKEILYVKNEQLNNKFFTPISLRYLNPKCGEMTLHCEKDLQQFASYFYENSTQQINSKFVHSFFIMINKPNQGGVFTIYDLEQNDVKEKLSDTEVKLFDGQIVNINNIQSLQVVLEEGDLLIFNGGNVWHRTEVNTSDEPRITIGGFIANGNNEDSIYIWS